MTETDANAATTFHRLHAPGRLLVLANAWDAGSARLMEECGARAIATTSAGVAWVHGYADGDALPVATVAGAIAEMTRVLRVPLSADIEGGYSHEPARVADVVRAVVDAGAVGINLEDGSREPDLLCAKIAAARTAAERAGVKLFINARTDVYLRRLVPAEAALEETVRRARRYREAGCDGVFVPRAADEAEVRALVAAVAPLPLNLLAGPGVPARAALEQLGVRRLSAGSAIAMAALGAARAIATRFLSDADSEILRGPSVEYAAMNTMLA
ncbi:MAG: isocitrate lyase/phosphoenolpyruvate mutase family protein [Elusimicrobiota bacterium]|nr:isocitrate lyase/phosphoenolpyruvate mutase family protein [Elusimicrobiota bacterium]